MVSRRQLELAEVSPTIVALSGGVAESIYVRAMGCVSKTRYGLNEMAFPHIERLNVDNPGPRVASWLAERVVGEELLLIFGRCEVFHLSAELFLRHWQDMMSPSRDDVVILPTGGDWALLYCHEDYFEFVNSGCHT